MHLSADELAAVRGALRGHGDHDSGVISDTAVARAVYARMQVVGASKPASYISCLQKDEDECQRLLTTLNLAVTRFFRDPDVFSEVARSIIPGLVELAVKQARPLRVWVPGCASGEEAYTLAMLLLHFAEQESTSPELQITATDIDEGALDTARAGNYPASIENDLPEDMRLRFLKRKAGEYRVNSRLSAACEFLLHDLNDAAPVARVDMISCRNVLMYVELPARQRILARFYETLRPGGVLLLGPAEDVDDADDLFEAHEKRYGLYRSVSRSAPAEVMPRSEDDKHIDEDGNQEMTLAEQLELRNAELERLNRDLGYQIDQLETTLSLVPVGIAICEDPSSETFRVNREGGVLLGVPENSTINAAGHVRDIGSQFSVRNIDNPDTPTELPFRRVLESGEEVIDQALRVIRSDNSQIDILASAVPLLDQNQRVRGAIAAFIDNTGQEKERRQLTARHAAERAVSRLGIEMLSEHDTNIVIEMALDELVRDLGIEIAAVFEFRPSEGDLILRAGTGWRDVDSDEATLSPAFDVHGPSPFIISDLREGENFSPPAWLVEQEVVSGVGTAIRRPGEPYGALAVFSRSARRFSEVEINFLDTVAALLGAALERDEMERMLVETRDRLTLADARQAAERAEQLASLGTLAAGISHEINNPLNSILVNAELGLMKLSSGQDGEKVRPVLETIVEDVRRCARITQSVLNLAKNPGAPKAPANLNDIVLRARDLVASHLQLHDAGVDLELGDLPAQHLDANAMESAMINLMRNAAESRRHGVTVSVRTGLDGDTVIVEVSDDGPGIAPEHLDHVFDPFYSTKRSGKGTGLGLSLVHSTVIDHGGEIRVTSSEGVGTTFEIRLPLSDEPGDSGEEATPG